MFNIDKCCFCVDLKTGCFIIAYIQLLIDALTFALALYGIIDGTVLMTSKVEVINELGFILLSFSILFLTFLGLMFVFTIVLIIGLNKRNRNYIRAYLICSTTFLLVYAVTAFVSFPMVKGTVLDITYKLVNLALNVYFVIVIRSYWMLMVQSNHESCNYTLANTQT